MTLNKRSEALIQGLIALYILIILFPFLWVLVTSFKPEAEIWSSGAFSLLADHPTLEHYRTILTGNVVTGLKNSFVIAGLTTLYVTGIAILAAYALVRLHFPGKRVFLAIILATSMFPQMIAVGPIYNLFVALGWTNSWFIVLPYSMISLPVAVYILTTHFRKIPYGLEEAASIDGATPLQTLFRIMIPLALPGIFTSAIITFIGVWNEYLLALTLNPDLTWRTAPVAISFLRGQFNVFWGQVAASVIVVTVPTLFIILLFQKQIISGLTSGALKD